MCNLFGEADIVHNGTQSVPHFVALFHVRTVSKHWFSRHWPDYPAPQQHQHNSDATTIQYTFTACPSLQRQWFNKPIIWPQLSNTIQSTYSKDNVMWISSRTTSSITWRNKEHDLIAPYANWQIKSTLHCSQNHHAVFIPSNTKEGTKIIIYSLAAWTNIIRVQITVIIQEELKQCCQQTGVLPASWADLLSFAARQDQQKDSRKCESFSLPHAD